MFFLYENNKFRSYRKDQEGNEYWRCTISGCKARLTTSNDSELMECISSHTHGDTVQNESVQTLRTACKRKATETVGERPSKVIKTCLKQHGESDVTSSDVNNVRAAMYRERRKHCGVLPRNVDDTTLKQLPMLTSRREDFLCRCETTDNGGEFVVFTTRTNLETLCNADVITMGGTFRVCPKFFHCPWLCEWTLYPLVHCLLSNKSTATYVHMLNTVQANCAVMNFYFAPRNVVIDFESSMLSAIWSVLPKASVHCCRFHHLGQAWWRHMNSIGLGLIYKDRSSDVAHWLQLDCHFYQRTKLQMLLLMTSCQMHRRLILR